MPSADSLLRIVRAEGISDRRVLDAFEKVDRADFIPKGVPREEAYFDEPIRIGQQQTTSQPSLIARMVEALDLPSDAVVLEIGTGLGFQTAILAEFSKLVVSIERFDRLAELARRNLEAAGYKNVVVMVGDGTRGAPEHAPFHGIIGSAAARHIPEPLVEQLAEDGRIVMPMGPGGNERVELYEKHGDSLRFLNTVAFASFVPMVGNYDR